MTMSTYDPAKRAYMREYMRGYYRKHKRKRVYDNHVVVRDYDRAPIDFNPAYDPQRDGFPVHRDLTASLMGDPPVGRSALDTARSDTRG